MATGVSLGVGTDPPLDAETAEMGTDPIAGGLLGAATVDAGTQSPAAPVVRTACAGTSTEEGKDACGRTQVEDAAVANGSTQTEGGCGTDRDGRAGGSTGGGEGVGGNSYVECWSWAAAGAIAAAAVGSAVFWLRRNKGNN